ncbi:MAG: hypothetical protein JSS76_08300 [Bacteroidetes bacterium]|nr:hypothetical protein [Bacteroidota bacterium]
MPDSTTPVTITVLPQPSRPEQLKATAERLYQTAWHLQTLIADAELGERIILNKNLAKIYDAAKAIEYIADRDKFSKPNNNSQCQNSE